MTSWFLDIFNWQKQNYILFRIQRYSERPNSSNLLRKVHGLFAFGYVFSVLCNKNSLIWEGADKVNLISWWRVASFINGGHETIITHLLPKKTLSLFFWRLECQTTAKSWAEITCILLFGSRNLLNILCEVLKKCAQKNLFVWLTEFLWW